MTGRALDMREPDDRRVVHAAIADALEVCRLLINRKLVDAFLSDKANLAEVERTGKPHSDIEELDVFISEDQRRVVATARLVDGRTLTATAQIRLRELH